MASTDPTLEPQEKLLEAVTAAPPTRGPLNYAPDIQPTHLYSLSSALPQAQFRD